MGRRMPSLRMRACKVVRFIPRMLAAPFGSGDAPFGLAERAKNVLALSASSSVATRALLALEALNRERRSGVREWLERGLQFRQRNAQFFAG